MKTVGLEEIQHRFDELARNAERGDVVTITHGGKALFDIVAHKGEATTTVSKVGGIDWEAGEAYLRSKGVIRTEGFIAEDFDEPLPEDFLLRPLP